MLAASRVARQLTGGGQDGAAAARPVGDRVLERLLDDRVDEPRRPFGIQDLGLDQRVHRVSRRLAVHARDRGDVGQRGIVAEDREHLRDAPAARHAATMVSSAAAERNISGQRGRTVPGLLMERRCGRSPALRYVDPPQVFRRELPPTLL